MYKKFNINNFIKVKLTLEGKLALYRLKTYYGSEQIDCSYILSREDNNGYVRLKLWEFIKIFGPYIENGYTNNYFEDFIMIDDNDLVREQKKLVYY